MLFFVVASKERGEMYKVCKYCWCALSSEPASFEMKTIAKNEKKNDILLRNNHEVIANDRVESSFLTGVFNDFYYDYSYTHS